MSLNEISLRLVIVLAVTAVVPALVTWNKDRGVRNHEWASSHPTGPAYPVSSNTDPSDQLSKAIEDLTRFSKEQTEASKACVAQLDRLGDKLESAKEDCAKLQESAEKEKTRIALFQKIEAYAAAVFGILMAIAAWKLPGGAVAALAIISQFVIWFIKVMV